MLTIVIPVKDQISPSFIEANKRIFEQFPVIIIDSGGGEALREMASCYIREQVSLWEARRLGYSKTQTPYVLNLDSDVLIPKGYIEQALAILERQPKVGAVSLFFEDIRHRGILEYGISLWRTEVVKRLYDYDPRKLERTDIIQLSPQRFVTVRHGYCECLYMWEQLLNSGYKLETLPIRAKHLKVRLNA